MVPRDLLGPDIACQQAVLLGLSELLDLPGIFPEPEDRKAMAQALRGAWTNKHELAGQLRRCKEFLEEILMHIEKFNAARKGEKEASNGQTLGSVFRSLQEQNLPRVITGPGKKEKDSGWALAFSHEAKVSLPALSEGVLFDLKTPAFRIVCAGDLPYHARRALNRLLARAEREAAGQEIKEAAT